MLTPGDVVEIDLGMPAGSEAGLLRPAVVVTAGRILLGRPNVVQVVPLTRTFRQSGTEVVIDPDGANRLGARSSAQCQHVRSVATNRIRERVGNVGPVYLTEVRETLALLLDLEPPSQPVSAAPGAGACDRATGGAFRRRGGGPPARG